MYYSESVGNVSMRLYLVNVLYTHILERGDGSYVYIHEGWVELCAQHI